MASERTILFKIGGSLFSLPDLPERLRSVFELAEGRILVVPGGGATTDQVRDWDGVFRFPSRVSHQLAIDALSLNARFLASLIPESRIGSSLKSIYNNGPLVTIVDVASLISEMDEQGFEVPPAGWHVTSDSLAGWLASQWAIDQLVLVKSVEPPNLIPISGSEVSSNRHCLPEQPVDGWFSTLIPNLPPVSWCNLRGENRSLIPFKRVRTGLQLDLNPDPPSEV